jgi:hypothetical protein
MMTERTIAMVFAPGLAGVLPSASAGREAPRTVACEVVVPPADGG